MNNNYINSPYVPAQTLNEQSYIENILRLNKGKKVEI